MKPTFALTLSFEGIGLLHRAPGGWLRVGEAALDSSDLSAALDGLREDAARLSPDGLLSKLVIPNEQIRYLEIETAGVDDAELPAIVARALDGATPYAVHELAFDFARDGAHTHVAAVAKETLAEAEAFAVDHGFNPVSFVAIPESGFPGEPFFGLTASAPDLLDASTTLVRDLQPIRVIGAATLPEAGDETTPHPESDQPSGLPLSEEGPAAIPDVSHEPASDLPGPGPETPIHEQETVADRAAEVAPPPDTTPPRTTPPEATSTETEPPVLAKTPDPAALGGTLRATKTEDSAPAFTSIRARRDMPPAPATIRPVNPTAPTIDIDEETAAPAPPLGQVGTGLADRFGAALRGSAQAGSGVAAQAGRIGAFFSRSRETSAATAVPTAGLTAQPALPAPVPAVPPVQSERQRMTVFGARKPEKTPPRQQVGGKPRYLGLILTAILLVFLLGVAAMASIFTEDGLSRLFAPRNEPATAIAEAPSYDDDPMLVEGDEAGADEGLNLAALDPGDFGEAMAIEADEQVSLAPPQTEPALTDEEVAARYAATGIWQLAPEAPPTPGYSQLEDLYIASIDGAVTATDAVALPPLSQLLVDRVPGSQSSPAAAGTTFEFDDRGLVIALPDGALTPDGVPVFAGRPEVLPAAWPARAAPAIEEPTPDSQFAALRDPRPRPRPGDLVQQNERSQLGGLTRDELAQLRPRLRPALPARALEPEPDTSPADDEDETAAPPQDTGTALAVDESIKPKPRPRGFERTVQQAQARAAAAPAPSRVTRADPEEEEEPEVAQASARSVAPRVPSSASVAREATVRNALNLNRMNLIGVYGKPNSRSALIRMSNGRYRKVQVGDNLDGGRVSAIGDGELRYTKGGRQITLKMPRG